MERKKILITGASGFIGSSLALELCKNNNVYALARFTNSDVKKNLEKSGIEIIQKDIYKHSLDDLPNDFDYIFSQLVSIDFQTNQQKVFDVNTYFVGRLMKQFSNASGIILGSSGSVYKPRLKELLNENGEIGPVNLYGISKLGGELLGRFLSEQWDIPTCILRYFFPYGSNGGTPTKWAKQIYYAEDIQINTNYSAVYSPIYISDCIRYTIESSLYCSVPAKIINIGGLETTSQLEIIKILSKKLNKNPIITHTNEVPRFWNGDFGLMLNLFGKPAVNLNKGLSVVVNSILNNKI